MLLTPFCYTENNYEVRCLYIMVYFADDFIHSRNNGRQHSISLRLPEFLTFRIAHIIPTTV